MIRCNLCIQFICIIQYLKRLKLKNDCKFCTLTGNKKNVCLATRMYFLLFH